MSMKIERSHVLSLVIGLLVGGLGVFLIFGLGVSGKSSRDSLPLYPKTSASVKDWLVKIDDYVIPKKEFEELFDYTMQTLKKQGADLSQMPDESLIKGQLLESLIGQYAIVIQALKSDVLSKKDARQLLEMQVRQAIQQMYLQELMPKDRSQFMPSKVEINQFYQQNKAELVKRGYSASQIKQLATEELFKRKTQIWIQKTVEEIKEKYKIERNTALIESLGIKANPTPLSTLPSSLNQ